MTNKDLSNLRVDYSKHTLLEADAGTNPITLFGKWYDEASNVELEANICMLSTFGVKPSVRVILLKEVKDGQFVFFTNYNSQKGRDIHSNPNVSLIFFWQQTQRQVRIEGTARKVSSEDSDAYFYSRPLESQIGAIVSNQSEVLENRQVLDEKFEALKAFYKENSIQRPEYWGGYAIEPLSIEFWQGRASRLHDRLRFRRSEKDWIRERLSP